MLEISIWYVKTFYENLQYLIIYYFEKYKKRHATIRMTH